MWNSFLNSISLYQSDFLRRYTSELKLLFQVYIWYKKQYLSNSSIGLDIFKLKFYSSSAHDNADNSPNSLQKCSFLFPIALVYLKERLSHLLDVKTSLIVEKLGAILQLANIVNTFLLIFDGRYRTLQERIFSIRLGMVDPSTRDSISHTFLNRELTWRSLSEILTLLLPHLLASTRIKSTFQFVQRQLDRARNVAGINNSNENSSIDSSQSISFCCSFCGQSAINATTFSHCKHIYCYCCLAGRLKTDSLYRCETCGASIQSLDQLLDRFAIN